MAELDWKALATSTMHDLQVQILERAVTSPSERFSPVELAAEFRAPLGNVSYHVRVLLGRGLLKKAGTATRRGAVQHYYAISAAALR
jgi:hypothetical protein